MGKYQFGSSEYDLIRNSSVPLAVYQYIDGHVHTNAVSQGFLDLFGFDELEDALYYLDRDLFRDTHPDDLARVSEAAYRFAAEDVPYEVVYRNKSPKDPDYRIIHAKGNHEIKEDGSRIAVVWYTDEGRFVGDSSGFTSSINQAFNNALYRESIIHESHYDSLTGLPNLAHFLKLSEAGRDDLLDENRQPAMIYFDLNGMKRFNSKYGFNEGNNLLRAFADILVKNFGNDRCGRIGSDHFIAYSDDDGLRETLEKIFGECRGMNDGKTVTVRAGIFMKLKDVTLDAAVACDRAKAAADSIKFYHRSAYKYFDEEMLAESEHKQYILENLDRAISEKWIKVYYQPIVRAANGKVCDEEALSRWIDPVKGFLPPDRFIPVIEAAGLTYKLDLYVLEQILDKIKASESEGLYIVPQSLNLSRYDFEACDIVEEVRQRVDEAGVDRSKITIEITESVIGSDFEYMKEQVERFHDLGFNVWMDDFGSDYSSLDFLQSIPFDLIKLDMRFMQQFYDSDKTKIILTELVRMALNLGLETVAEGVEDEAQVEFLREIGCTKLQGYYYCKPIPPEDIVDRYRTGTQIGFENPEESGYYEAIGKINLYDVTAMSREERSTLRQYFDTIPMEILEFDGGSYRAVRRNKSFRDFMSNIAPKPSRAFLEATRKCGEEGSDLVIDEELEDGTVIHTYLKRVAVNPVNGNTALAVAILATTSKDDTAAGVSFAAVARALSADYSNLFYINLETEDFIQYNTDHEYGELAVERHESNFFSEVVKDASSIIYAPDLKPFLSAFNKENLLRGLEEDGVYKLTYRQLVDGEPAYMSMKASYIGNDESHVIIGVSNVDNEMKHKTELAKIREERATYSKIKALTGDYLSFYTVDPVTNSFIEYSAASEYEDLGYETKGDDFFSEARKEAVRTIHPQDVDLFLTEFTKENVLDAIKENGLFSIRYRLMINGESRYVNFRAAMTGEKGSEEIAIGVMDIDARVRREQELVRKSDRMRYMSSGTEVSDEMMFQMLVDNIGKPAAVLSVEKKKGGGYGEIRIVRANSSYRETMGSGYRDDMLYHELVPRDVKFEDYCYHAAILGQKMHSYVETKALNAWTDFEILPLNSGSDTHGYCIFLFEFTKGPEADRMSNVSMETASLVIESCIKLLGSKNFKESVGRVIEDVRTLADAFSCRIMLVNHDKKEIVNYSVSQRKGEPGVGIPVEAVLPYNVVRTWDAMIDESNVVIIKDEQDMLMLEEKNPVWAESLRSCRIHSLIFIPLYQNRTIFGYMYVANFNVDKVVEIKEVLELLSFFLGSEISNNLLMERMDMMIRTDALTGMNNRYAMIQRIGELSGKAFGVVSIDLNGLKRVNDTKGHDAGDGLLVQASEVLSKVFYHDDIFRTGGDEFMVIINDIRQDVFERKIARLRRDADKNMEVSFAMGSFWSDGSISAAAAFKKAEDSMYEDKKLFYERNPELRRV